MAPTEFISDDGFSHQFPSSYSSTPSVPVVPAVHVPPVLDNQRGPPSGYVRLSAGMRAFVSDDHFINIHQASALEDPFPRSQTVPVVPAQAGPANQHNLFPAHLNVLGHPSQIDQHSFSSAFPPGSTGYHYGSSLDSAPPPPTAQFAPTLPVPNIVSDHGVDIPGIMSASGPTRTTTLRQVNRESSRDAQSGRRHYNTNKYSCVFPGCSVSSPTQVCLEQHLREDHAGIPSQCSGCKKTNKRIDLTLRHVRSCSVGNASVEFPTLSAIAGPSSIAQSSQASTSQHFGISLDANPAHIYDTRPTENQRFYPRDDTHTGPELTHEYTPYNYHDDFFPGSVGPSFQANDNPSTYLAPELQTASYHYPLDQHTNHFSSGIQSSTHGAGPSSNANDDSSQSSHHFRYDHHSVYHSTSYVHDSEAATPGASSSAMSGGNVPFSDDQAFPQQAAGEADAGSFPELSPEALRDLDLMMTNFRQMYPDEDDTAIMTRMMSGSD